MGLTELINYRLKNPECCYWKGNIPNITPNGILHGLRFEATVHWNNCKSTCDERCLSAGEMVAKEYTNDVENGRPDLHPYDDDEVWKMAFEIHAKRTYTCGRRGAMLPSFRNKESGCNCYLEAYQVWLGRAKLLKVIANTLTDPDDRHYEPRFE